MKRKFLSAVLVIVMFISLVSISVIAAETLPSEVPSNIGYGAGKSVQLGTGEIAGYDSANGYHYIYYGIDGDRPIIWRVLSDQTNMATDDGFFMLSEYVFGTGEYGGMVFNDYNGVTQEIHTQYQGSDAQKWCQTFETAKLSSLELSAALETTISDAAFSTTTGYGTQFVACDNILNKDKVFFPSAKELETTSYGFTMGNMTNNNKKRAGTTADGVDYAYWLRSPAKQSGGSVGVGFVQQNWGYIMWEDPYNDFAVRPAFNLDKSKVVFIESASGAQTDIGLTAVADNTVKEWKLNLIDSNRNFAVSETALSGNLGETVSVNYSGALAGTNEYVSAMIADESNNVLYHGQLANNSESGSAELTIPDDIASGTYTLKVFSEQINGDKKTDYVSASADVALTVTHEHDFDTITDKCPCGAIKISTITFPDNNFRSWITNNIAGADDGILTADELLAVKEISVVQKDIDSLTGIEHFTAIETLDCYGNALTKLDVSKNTELITLGCNANRLTALDVSKNIKLTTLKCQGNQIKTLDLSNNTELLSLECHSNLLEELDLSQNIKLTNLNCEGNLLKELDLRANTALLKLICRNNSLTSLDVRGVPLTDLNCGTNNLKSLDFSNMSTLISIYCFENELTSINVSGCTSLKTLSIANNNLTSLDLTETNIQTLWCKNNQLMSLELSTNATITTLQCDEQRAIDIVIDENFCYTLPDSVDASKVTVTSGATLDGKVLKGILGTSVAYTYDLGLADKSLSVTFNVTNPHEHTQIGYCVCGGVAVNDTNFPDDIFRNYVSTNFDADKNGVLSTAESTVSTIRINNMNIADLTGIEYFWALNDLECDGNRLTSLDMSKNTALKKLFCANNQLTSLNVSTNWALGVLVCEGNKLTSLDVSKNGELEILFCGNNDIASLDLSGNGQLWKLSCNDNHLQTLDLSANVLLEELYCQNNLLTSLDLSANTLIQNEYFTGSGQASTITIDANDSYTLPNDIDASRITVVFGAVLDGNVLKDIFGDTVVYEYATGLEGKVLSVTLNVTNPHTHDFGTTDACVCGAIKISDKIFPDANFLAFVKTLTGAEDEMFTAEELAAITEIDVNFKNIRDIKGIEHFTELTSLILDTNNISTVDVSKNIKLKKLSIYACQTKVLNVSKNTELEILNCSRNLLTSLDVSNNTKLQNLNCKNNPISNLDLSNNPELTMLTVEDDELTYLDLSANTNLQYFYGYDNSHTLTISIDAAATYTLPAEMDASKVTVTSGAVLDGNVLKKIFGNEIVYTYATGVNGKDLVVTLTVENPHTHSTTGICDCGLLSINDTFFPDNNFRNYISTSFDIDSDGFLSIDELAAVTQIEYTYGRNHIGNLTGIEHFGKLTDLKLIDQFALRYADLISNTELVNIHIEAASLQTIKLPETTTLTNIYLDSNELTSIDVSKLTALTHLNVGHNRLEALAIENNTELQVLNCTDNQLTSIDVSKNTKLIELNVSANGEGLKSLDISENTALQILWCINNKLTELDVSKNTALTELVCYNNKLTSLDVSKNTALTSLNCRQNQIAVLDLSKNTGLIYLDCSENNLISLSASASNNFAQFNADKQTATVKILGNSLDLTRIDPSFDGSRATIATAGASFNGNAIVLANDMSTVEYSYATGNDSNMLSVTLTIEQVDYTEELKKVQNALDAAIAELEAAIAEKATPADIQTAIENLTTAYEAADKALKNELVAADTKITEKIDALEEALLAADKVLTDAITALDEKLDKAIEDLEAAIAKGDKDLNDKLLALDEAYKAADAVIDDRLNKLAEEDIAIKASISSLEGQLATTTEALEAAIAKVQSNLDAAVKELNDAIEQNKTELSEKIKAVEDAFKNADSIINGKIASLVSADKAINASISALEDSLANTKTELKNAIDTVAANLETAKSELNKAIVSGDTALDEKITALDNAYKAADALINSSISELDSKTSASITALQNSLAGVKSELEAAIAKVQKNLDDAKAELDAKYNELAQKDNGLDDKITVLIVILTIVGIISVGSAIAIAITFVGKRKE